MLSSIILLVPAIAVLNIVFSIFSKVTSNRKFRREQLELARITSKGITIQERVEENDSERESTINSFKAKGWELLSTELPLKNTRANNHQPSMVFSRVTSEHFR